VSTSKSESLPNLEEGAFIAFLSTGNQQDKLAYTYKENGRGYTTASLAI
jgi:hypothetical protein